MGCDGGTIPTRDELVRTKKKPEQKDKDSERLFQWQHCHLTQETLRRPVVACQLGRLYNKEAILRRLLDKKSGNVEDNGATSADHIKSLKDVRELDLTANPTFSRKNPSVGDGYVDRLVSPWICPVTGLEMNGRFKFVADWRSGRVLSERGHNMMKKGSEDRIGEEDLVVLNPTDKEDEDSNAVKRDARKARAKAEKKAGKRKAEDGEEDVKPSTSKSSDKPKKSKPSTEKNGKKPVVTNSDLTPKNSDLQKDPSKSEVYKSLFSSHSSAQNRPKGNWVTFDPRYN